MNLDSDSKILLVENWKLADCFGCLDIVQQLSYRFAVINLRQTGAVNGVEKDPSGTKVTKTVLKNILYYYCSVTSV